MKPFIYGDSMLLYSNRLFIKDSSFLGIKVLRNGLIDQLGIKGDEIELFRKLVPVCLFTKSTESSKLQEINPTFDAQNMPKNANNKILSGFIQLFENFNF